MNHNLACIIISNSDDFRFVLPNLEQIHTIFKRITIAIGNQLWNGEMENQEKISYFKNLVSKQCKNVDVVEYDADSGGDTQFVLAYSNIVDVVSIVDDA